MIRSDDPVEEKTSPWAAVGLLLESAAPEKPTLRRGLIWLVLAAALEALGPIIGKHYIDAYLLPRHFDPAAMGALLASTLLTGWAASWIHWPT